MCGSVSKLSVGMSKEMVKSVEDLHQAMQGPRSKTWTTTRQQIPSHITHKVPNVRLRLTQTESVLFHSNGIDFVLHHGIDPVTLKWN